MYIYIYILIVILPGEHQQPGREDGGLDLPEPELQGREVSYISVSFFSFFCLLLFAFGKNIAFLVVSYLSLFILSFFLFFGAGKDVQFERNAACRKCGTQGPRRVLFIILRLCVYVYIYIYIYEYIPLDTLYYSILCNII